MGVDLSETSCSRAPACRHGTAGEWRRCSSQGLRGGDALLKRPLQLQAHMRQQMLDCENVNFMNSNLKLVNLRDANLKCPPALGQRADGGVQLAGATGWVPADKDSCNARLKVATMASYNLLNLEDAILHRKPVKRHS